MSEEHMRQYEKDGEQPLKADTKGLEKIERFITELAELELKKQLVNDEIKTLKADYKEGGVAVGLVSRIFAIVRKNRKKTEKEKFHEEVILEWLQESKIVDEACLLLERD